MSDIIIPSNPVTRKQIRDAVIEISDSLTRIASERALIKSIVDEKAEGFGLEKKVLKKMATTWYKDSFSKDVAESEDFAAIYEIVLQQTTAPVVQFQGTEEVVDQTSHYYSDDDANQGGSLYNDREDA